MLDDWYRCEIQPAFVRPIFARSGDAESTAIGKREVTFVFTIGDIVFRIPEMIEETCAEHERAKHEHAKHERDDSDDSDGRSALFG
jgi:hypothetical protein